MTKENKQLLLKDLCARLPYGVVCADKYVDEKFVNKWDVLAIDAAFGDDFSQVYISNCEVTYGYKTSITNIKPYLFPLSSMTEEQKRELNELLEEECKIIENVVNNPTSSNVGFPVVVHYMIDWCNKNHFDYRGLIPLGLANDATGLNIY